MDIGTNQAENPGQEAHINFQTEFSTLKRQLLIFLPPVVIAAGVALEALRFLLQEAGAPFGLAGFLVIIFGLWMPFHGIFGYAEVWRFEDQAVIRVRRNLVWTGEKHWPYSAIKNVRFKSAAGHVRPEMLIQGKGWLPLPEQADQDTAERLKTLIDNFKRAAVSGEQA